MLAISSMETFRSQYCMDLSRLPDSALKKEVVVVIKRMHGVCGNSEAAGASSSAPHLSKPDAALPVDTASNCDISAINAVLMGCFRDLMRAFSLDSISLPSSADSVNSNADITRTSMQLAIAEAIINCCFAGRSEDEPEAEDEKRDRRPFFSGGGIPPVSEDKSVTSPSSFSICSVGCPRGAASALVPRLSDRTLATAVTVLRWTVDNPVVRQYLLLCNRLIPILMLASDALKSITNKEGKEGKEATSVSQSEKKANKKVKRGLKREDPVGPLQYVGPLFQTLSVALWVSCYCHDCSAACGCLRQM